MDLPSSKSPDLHLTQPTAAERQTTCVHNAEEWKGPLSLPAYLHREQVLASTPLTQAGGMTPWILTTAHSKPDQRLVLANCESVKNRALVSYQTKRGVRVDDITCHRIGSVFTEKKLRGHGYARRMLQELGRKLPLWQTERDESHDMKCMFSVLFSDIGKTFYAKHHWYPFPSSHLILPATEDAYDAHGLRATRPVYREGLKDLCAVDECLLRAEFAKISESKVRVAIIPDFDIIDWHHVREDYLGQQLFGRKPDVKGAIIGAKEGKRAWCIWTRVYLRQPDSSTMTPTNTLYILRLVVESDGGSEDEYVEKVAALLRAAQHEASRWKLDDVRIWNPSPCTVIAAQFAGKAATRQNGSLPVQVIDREQDSICSLMWYGDNDNTNLKDLPWSDVEWVSNERYGWC